jgi:major membrane immunogen (membrane-anchored lipoprotein)
MKKPTTCSLLALMLVPFFFVTVLNAQDLKLPVKTNQETSMTFKDGMYVGTSRAKYTLEPYWGKVKLTIKKGLISDIHFAIRDSSLHETFDGNYEKHFEGNPEYIQQSRNDWKGVQTYTKKLSEKKEIGMVDAVSGATWSYNIFKASVNDALDKAR